MIEAVEWKFRMGRGHVRGVGFDEDALGWEGGKDGSDLVFSGMEEGAGEGKVGTEFEAFAGGFERAAEGVE